MEQYEFNQPAGTMTTLPHVSDAERSVLGSMLIDAGALEVSLEQLREEDYYGPQTRRSSPRCGMFARAETPSTS